MDRVKFVTEETEGIN